MRRRRQTAAALALRGLSVAPHRIRTDLLLVETQAVRSRSTLLKELQGLPVTKAVIHRNVDKKAWEQIVKDNPGARVVTVIT